MEESRSRASTVEVDLQALLSTYLRKWWVISICLLLAGAIAFACTYFLITPVYQAKVSVYVNNRGSQNANYVSPSDLSASSQLVETYMSMVSSDRVLDKVSDKMNNAYTTNQIRSCMAVSQVKETEIFHIYVSHTVPEEAARIVNTIAEIAPTEIAGLVEGSSARVVDMAKVPEAPASPSYIKMTMLGGVLGALIAVAFITVQFLQDTRIKDEDDLLALYNLPILGRVPDFDQDNMASRYGYRKYGYYHSYSAEPAAKEAAQ